MLALSLASMIDVVISSHQSAFVKGRQISDGPLMVNEVIEWYKTIWKKIMMLKFDFEKAFNVGRISSMSLLNGKISYPFNLISKYRIYTC